MKIKLTSNGGMVIATGMLEDHPSARDFAALLPLTLTLMDYAETEKISDLPRAITTHGAPDACTPVAGDISFYAPWGNLALFYENGHLSPGLVRLGRLQSGIAEIGSVGAAHTVEITLLEE
ncbi:cyclophilin-like fold protein [Pseudacidovorax sp. RU35E]|jgi:hypothetical protein|uniref:cyclophilin-like fold protein n=1 Tax=Pseudacidovorax sp. RU35E TaxID=1907403 RepID=UPI000956D283|nr:cyclophilin-like fold protein [Pseudacidovorax sp. RU35E]SIR76115.1 hypothetical protein SAMN05880557_11937 [Pseudacidovorax sp. RU35E]